VQRKGENRRLGEETGSHPLLSPLLCSYTQHRVSWRPPTCSYISGIIHSYWYKTAMENMTNACLYDKIQPNTSQIKSGALTRTHFALNCSSPTILCVDIEESKKPLSSYVRSTVLPSTLYQCHSYIASNIPVCIMTCLTDIYIYRVFHDLWTLLQEVIS